MSPERDGLASLGFLPAGWAGVQDLPNRFNVLRPDFKKLEVDTDASDSALLRLPALLLMAPL